MAGARHSMIVFPARLRIKGLVARLLKSDDFFTLHLLLQQELTNYAVSTFNVVLTA